MSRAPARAAGSTADPDRRWTVGEALETYAVREWGKGYFDINAAGHLAVHPTKQPDRVIDLKALVDDLAVRDIHPPLLLRFTDMLRHRVHEMASAFQRAIAENRYKGGYCCVYPIKVNQERYVVEDICRFGAEYGFGLEAGSKPELLAVLAQTRDDQTPIICNGFKDDEFIEMVVLAQKLGKRVIPVVEKFSELELIARHGEAHGVKPDIGIRVKLSTRGSGRWETSGGARSKFGLFISELTDALAYLEARGMADCLKLLHFHIGSQVTNIRSIKDAVNELTRIYTSLKAAGAGLEMLDIGGGLGVDYDGSQTSCESSINYTLGEYAGDVIYRIGSICDEAGVDHPQVISESGRAMVAYHSALVFDVRGVAGFDRFHVPEHPPTDADGEVPGPLNDLVGCYRELSRRNLRECYHDAAQAYEQAISLFNLGHLTLDQRAFAERIYWASCARIERLARALPRVPDELAGLSAYLCDTYFCNLSIFQSLPDSWAVDQVFPIMPIHRLSERPTRQGTLADISCDSDGKIDRFIGLQDEQRTLPLHPLNGEPYFLGAFLVGAYQEILGDMHNLFGDTHVVHVGLDEDDGHVNIDKVVPGETVDDVLRYVEFSAQELAEQMRRDVERAVKRGKASPAEAARFMRYYEAGLKGYTYLEDSSA